MKRAAVILTFALLALPALASAKNAPSPGKASCKAQLAAIGATNFKNMYGRFGTCVSRMNRATPAQRRAILSAEKTCRAEQLAGPAAFTAKYGSNANKRNAFGKCVSQHASTKSSGGGNVAAKRATGDFTFTAGGIANRHVAFDVRAARGNSPAGGTFSYNDATSSYSVGVTCVVVNGNTAYIGGPVQNATGFNPPLASPTYLLAKAVDNGSSGDTYSGSFVGSDPCPTLGSVSPADGPFAITSGTITVKS